MFCRITLGQINPVTDILNGKIKLSRGIFSIARFAFFGALFSNRQIDLKLPTSISNPAQWIKPEKILLVNGSPRKNGSTKLMLEWFMEGLPGDNTDIVDVSSLKIGKCLNCFKCWTDHPTVCVREDDAKIFRQKINEADLIVFFVPLSYMTMPADMKAAFERLFPETTPFFYHNKPTKTSHPLHRGKKPQAFLQFLLWGFPEKRHGQFLEGVYVEWAMHSHKNYIGSLMRPGINMILGDPRMQYIRRNIRNAIKATAQSVYNTGVIPEKERKIIEREDYMSIKDFYFYATHYLMDRFKTDYWDSD
jgi:multimeric flavodoxin WrbA